MIIKILGIDASLRTTGFGIIKYDTVENEIWTADCGVIQTPVKFKGTDAIKYMIEALYELNFMLKERDHTVIESPAAAYFATGFSSSGLIPVAHIAGAAAVIFGSEDNKFLTDKITLVRPTEWNKARKKEKTAEKMVEILGPVDEWAFCKRPKTDSKLEHLIDAIAMAFWYLEKEHLN